MNISTILAAGVDKMKEGTRMIGDNSSGGDLNNLISKVTSAIFLVLGIVAVFVIILGGFTMMTSTGDANKVKKGKDTILWGVIGLIITILAAAIVNWVLGQFN